MTGLRLSRAKAAARMHSRTHRVTRKRKRRIGNVDSTRPRTPSGLGRGCCCKRGRTAYRESFHSRPHPSFMTYSLDLPQPAGVLLSFFSPKRPFIEWYIASVIDSPAVRHDCLLSLSKSGCCLVSIYLPSGLICLALSTCPVTSRLSHQRKAATSR